MSIGLQPTIAVVFTGGTISMRATAEAGGIVPALSANEILEQVPGLEHIARLHIVEFGRFPGPHMTPEKMFELSSVVQSLAERDDIQGIVITHGTDTLEETAYFLDCTLRLTKPVVVIGAMRNSSELDWDGPRNLRDGILLACHAKARDLGVLVYLSENIHAASEVTKMDTSNMQTFESTNFGPLGKILNGSIFIYRKPVHRDYFKVSFVPRFVPIIKCYTTSEAELVRASIEAKASGIVIEAMGSGNVPPIVYQELISAVDVQIPIVLVSRCPNGRVEHTYAYEGAGKHLYHSGVIFADYLNGQKARIKLICALGASTEVEIIRRSFEWSA